MRFLFAGVVLLAAGCSGDGKPSVPPPKPPASPGAYCYVVVQGLPDGPRLVRALSNTPGAKCYDVPLEQ